MTDAQAYSAAETGQRLLAQGLPAEALPHLSRACALAPDIGEFHYALGVALKRSGKMGEAARALKRAVLLVPDNQNWHLILADVLKEMGQIGASIAEVKRAVEIDPTADGLFRLACFLADDRQYVESGALLQKANDLDPNNAKIHEALGLRLQQLGLFDEAREHLEQAIALAPERSEPYHWLVRNRKMKASDMPFIEKMAEMASNQGTSDVDIRNLSYALGKSFEDLGRYKEAMEWYNAANAYSARLMPSGLRYSKREQEGLTDWIISHFSGEFLRNDKGIASESSKGILVVGMMRSGTTLLEQILSGHSAITAGGEIFFWTKPDVQRGLALMTQGKNDLPVIKSIAKAYLGLLKGKEPDVSRKVTDKNPLNYTMLGSIYALFPKFKIIHCRRNPLDTCLSLWTTPIHGANFLYHKENIVHAYGEYRRLMQHWREVLPEEFMLEVDYEDLVINSERVVREILTFCDLPWDENCLKVEERTGEVVTPSRWQVRQAIYKTSMERWRLFEPWLGEFNQLLPLAPSLAQRSELNPQISDIP